MILLCGIPSEPPLLMVTDALRERKVMPVIFNQRQFAETRCEFIADGASVRGTLQIGSTTYALEDFQGVYVRFMDDRHLPELSEKPDSAPERAYCRSLHDTLTTWFEVCGARVVNRASAMASNNSKPMQAQLIRKTGFLSPETLVTTDPEAVIEFRRRHGRIIYKSISGVRSIVQTFEEKDLERLDLIRWCPAQFQEWVEGEDVRVHVVGSAVFATRVMSEAVDYRYASQQVGTRPVLEAFELPAKMAENCLRLAAELHLPFAGIDLRFRPDGRVYCFEVNPSPGFSYYEANTDQPIAGAVADYLLGRANAVRTCPRECASGVLSDRERLYEGSRHERQDS